MPKVIHIKDWCYHQTAVPIFRPSKWGNGFIIGVDGTRKEVIEKYEKFQLPLLIKDIEELRGKDLVCFCKPKACHGDVLLRYANENRLSDF